MFGLETRCKEWFLGMNQIEQIKPILDWTYLLELQDSPVVVVTSRLRKGMCISVVGSESGSDIR